VRALAAVEARQRRGDAVERGNRVEAWALVHSKLRPLAFGKRDESA